MSIGDASPIEGLGVLAACFSTRQSAFACSKQACCQRLFVAPREYERGIHIRHGLWQSTSIAHDYWRSTCQRLERGQAKTLERCRGYDGNIGRPVKILKVAI
jgi:hypothetical protein